MQRIAHEDKLLGAFRVARLKRLKCANQGRHVFTRGKCAHKQKVGVAAGPALLRGGGSALNRIKMLLGCVQSHGNALRIYRIRGHEVGL